MKTYFLFILFLFVSVEISSQVVPVPHYDKVYDFLDGLYIRGIIDVPTEVRPYSRKDVADMLLEANTERAKLNALERQELDWYTEEYAYEMGLADETERWRAYSYEDSLFSFQFSPIIGMGFNSTGSSSGRVQWWGVRAFSSYSDWFGASIDARDKGEYGDTRDPAKFFTPKTGAFINGTPENGIEYNEIKGSITINNELGSISLIKEYELWGHGQYGQLIHSDKSASYPHIKLVLKPVEWMRFYYMHGWLSSLVDDSIYFYPTERGTDENPSYRKKYKDKYIAANMLTIMPAEWLDLSLGNSAIYSDMGVQPEYLIPFMVYKFLDHNAGRSNDYGGNGQIFLDALFKYPRNVQFYSTLFLDMTEVRNVLSENFSNTWFGITAGLKASVDPLIENLDVNVEYTRVNPWVYTHYIPTATYEHLNFPLGHWIGQNADQLRIQFDYSFLPRLRTSFYFERARKGGLDDINKAYLDDVTEPFLYSPVREDIRFGLKAHYQIFHELYAEGFYEYSDITDEDPNRTPAYLLGTNNTFSLRVWYGM